MTIPTNPQSTIYRNLYENTDPVLSKSMFAFAGQSEGELICISNRFETLAHCRVNVGTANNVLYLIVIVIGYNNSIISRMCQHISFEEMSRKDSFRIMSDCKAIGVYATCTKTETNSA